MPSMTHWAIQFLYLFQYMKTVIFSTVVLTIHHVHDKCDHEQFNNSKAIFPVRINITGQGGEGGGSGIFYRELKNTPNLNI